ncbi:leucine-rich repeat domain-containing protein [Candidatus Cytomitobacter indipagum]|uniref:Leucine-rich repeat domain-containing protein n=1 Tax=Candidatus Cytomitobacter indipagum TaxID=2601575 RepID=A0A5C0UE27_9PROT|nr:leucine-rich repeat domain-containing protein [Candidatus Cytomitobacter indipagum]QEK37960.1 leucine-rich repeat domain-containing protein [Candidatus Cytomitobacter indipagum]
MNVNKLLLTSILMKYIAAGYDAYTDNMRQDIIIYNKVRKENKEEMEEMSKNKKYNNLLQDCITRDRITRDREINKIIFNSISSIGEDIKKVILSFLTTKNRSEVYRIDPKDPYYKKIKNYALNYPFDKFKYEFARYIDADKFENVCCSKTRAGEEYFYMRYISLHDDDTNMQLNNLRELNLKNNKMIEIEPGIFDGLNNLKWLYLQNGQFTDLEEGVFKGLNSLTRLYMQNSQIVELRPKLFEGLNSLKKIQLDNNMITSINSGVFAGLRNLIKLDLCRNKITSINSETFKGIDFHIMKNINLNDNPLDYKSKEYLVKLKEVYPNINIDL